MESQWEDILISDTFYIGGLFLMFASFGRENCTIIL